MKMPLNLPIELKLKLPSREASSISHGKIIFAFSYLKNEKHKFVFVQFYTFGSWWIKICGLTSFTNNRDGQLKRMNAKKEWKQKQQEEFSKRLKVDWEHSKQDENLKM